MKGYAINTKVEWDWGKGKGRGKVTSRYTSNISKTIKGTEVSREASEQQPAYEITQDDGDKVLKSHSEVSKVNG
jgi:flagellar hook assembly protein FlgD